jgi:hypothetical protein
MKKRNPFDSIKEPVPTINYRPIVRQQVPPFYCQAYCGGKIGQHAPCMIKQCDECKKIVADTRLKRKP